MSARILVCAAFAFALGACDGGGPPPVLQGHALATCRGVPEVDCSDAVGICAGTSARCDDTLGWVCEPAVTTDYEAVETLCDGLDNDCDGVTDEALGTLSCGQGACAQVVARCEGGVPARCDPFAGAGDEVCDGSDNDCDGATDEELALVPLSARQLGVCAGAVANCGGSAGWIEPDYAEGLHFEATESSCDGRDNDCDGATDEELGTLECGLGVCAQSGPACVDGETETCDALRGAGDEACNGMDDDCDGLTDEDLIAAPARLHVGVCQGMTLICGAEAGWVEPVGEGLAGYELNETTCDGQDNDCDGEVDENGGTVTCGTGVCAHSEGACVDGRLVGCDAFRGAGAEVCDGLDNDCDGVTDEALTAPPADRRLGVCAVALKVCHGSAGWAEPSYLGVGGYESVEASCDGRDNDCDGGVDEELGTVTCGAGQCSHTVARCAGGRPVVCDPLAGADDELCDGRDNDCDGAADEDLVAPAAERGTGVCAPMAKVCRGPSGWGEPDYLHVNGFQPQESACDGLDNDCDGFTDESLGTTSCGVGVCAHVVLNCSGGAPNECDPFAGQRAEACNGLDDDCDGAIDDAASCGADQICEAGRCVGDGAICGNGLVEPGEQCDDGNLDGADDCDTNCKTNGLCSDACRSADDGVCDDGGLGAVSGACPYGSDCADCSVRRDDPCHELPAEGVCIGPASIGSCLLASGASAPRAVIQACAAGELCAIRGASLQAVCVPASVAECTPGETRCQEDSLLECDASGHWQRTICAGECTLFLLGSYCAEPADARVVAGTASYQARTANDTLTDWGAPFAAPLASVLLVSYVWHADTASYSVYDTAVTAADGSYELRVPAAPAPEDRVLAWLMRVGDDGRAVLAVANPSFTAVGRRSVLDVFAQVDASQIWSYSVASSSLVGDPAIALTEATHSAVARVFDHMNYVYDTTRTIFGKAGDSLVLWMQPDVTWECGACTARYPSVVGAYAFASSIWIGYGADQAYWSDAVIVHELGHWVMSSFGTSPREGGVHYVGQPTLPGQAWSEGFATFFSSLARGDQFYFDKQNGNFFWFDLREMAYASRGMYLPTPDGVGYPYVDDPILQLMDENVVAAMSYALAINAQPEGTTAAPRLEAEGLFLMQALASDRMNVKRVDPNATFQRRYVRHTWTLDADRRLANITPIWTTSSPMFADYLDALRCLGNATGKNVDPLVAESILTYPYPIGSNPICQ